MARAKLVCPDRRRVASPRRRPAIVPFAALLIGMLATLPAAACATRTAPQSSVEAVIVVLAECYLDRSVRQDREYIAPILQTAEGFVGIAAVGERGHDRFRVRIEVAPGEHLVALWHTHGKDGRTRGWFSAADTRFATRLGLPSYLTTPDGETRVYLPGDPTPVVRDARRAMPLGVAVGQEVHLKRTAEMAGLVASAVGDPGLGG